MQQVVPVGRKTPNQPLSNLKYWYMPLWQSCHEMSKTVYDDTPKTPPFKTSAMVGMYRMSASEASASSGSLGTFVATMEHTQCYIL